MGPARQPTARSITMSLRARGTSWSSVTRSPRMGPDGSRIRPSSASWALCVYASSLCDACRGSWMKPVGEPDAGNPHVRFDERGGETGRCRMAQVTAPFLDSTAVHAPPWRLAHPTSLFGRPRLALRLGEPVFLRIPVGAPEFGAGDARRE